MCATRTPTAPAASATPTYTRTPTSCRAVLPRVAPVESPVETFSQEIFFCGIERGASSVNISGAQTSRESRRQLPSGDCPIGCDGSQSCFGQVVDLSANTTHDLTVSQNAGICGVILRTSEDIHGDPLRIVQVSAAPVE